MVPRLAIYGATSTALAAAVIGSALHSRANFFAAAVTVGKSSGSLMVGISSQIRWTILVRAAGTLPSGEPC